MINNFITLQDNVFKRCVVKWKTNCMIKLQLLVLCLIVFTDSHAKNQILNLLENSSNRQMDIHRILL